MLVSPLCLGFGLKNGLVDEAQSHLRILCDVAPSWLMEETMHGRRYLKLLSSGSRDEAKASLLASLRQSA